MMNYEQKNWVDWYFGLFGRHYIATSVLTALAFFGIGAGISWAIDFLFVYLRSVPMYLALFGIAWVLFWAGWGSKRIASMGHEIRPAFFVKDNEYYSLFFVWLRRMFNVKLHIFGSIIIILVAWISINLSTWSGVFIWLPLAWSEGPYLWVKNLILDILLVPMGFLAFSSGAGIVVCTLFVSRVGQLPLVPVLDLARVKLRPITDFGLAVGLTWSVGVSLIVIFFSPAFGVFNVFVILVLTAIGITMIVWPQYVLHRAFARTKQQLLDVAAQMLNITPPADEQYTLELTISRLLESNSERMQSFIHSVAEFRTWAYDPGDLARTAGIWILPIASLIVSRLL